ncbi:uncharacterized protein TOT_030000546 [Theileria orientalis strain Shintoku]|uniref:30S ribosomal protein S6 n=1 Tax=Theileria orientalis strain Shintoku TaxID=869250 RepID=J4C8S2_THEOR|nr:uncharacterized protein TOT_030000546 [Theileria orientalis strain Shintoku]PVC49737.1 hypothetical protein MACL_00002771 [Theileria orientalis]BAM41283.1 uncharacterized protein TOT_030000546 [Theileria orientalis strain Shintoku]|eukprot:XP_009691584.1 uncharacterized protein TOT_030000546 [Theileria orientalis strain Shintoku]
MKPTLILILVIISGSQGLQVSPNSCNYNLYFISQSSFNYKNRKRSEFSLSASFTERLYKEIRRRIRRTRETVEQKRIRLEKEEKSKRDGLLYPPKTSYELYIAIDNQPLESVRNQFGHILSKLKKIGAENIHIYNLGLKTLVRPIKKRYEANFLLVNVTVYPSLINYIRLKLLEEKGVLRILVLRDDIADKQRRIYRDSNLYVRHPYFSKDKYKPLISRLKEPPNV